MLFAVSSRRCAIVGIINPGISVFISPSRSVTVKCELIGREAKRGRADSAARMMAGSAAAACLRPSKQKKKEKEKAEVAPTDWHRNIQIPHVAGVRGVR